MNKPKTISQLQNLNRKQPIIERFAIMDSGLKPNIAILELLNILGLPHDGTLDSVVDVSQKEFLQRTSDGDLKERWELKEIMPELRDKVMPIIKKLGILDEIPPANDYYDYVLVAGGLITRVRTRIKYLADLWQRGIQFNQIVFLGGERPLADSGRETPEVLLDVENKELPIRKGWQPPQELPSTELEMMQLVCDQASLPDDLRHKIEKATWVNAPMKLSLNGDAPLRPNTQDTVEKWMEMNPSPGTSLIISSNPSIGYQHSVCKTVLPLEFYPETVGESADPNLLLANYLREIARLLYQEKQRLLH